MIRSASTAGAIALVVAFLLLLGGCGSDAPSLTKAQFSKKANEICHQDLVQGEKKIVKTVEAIPPSEAEHISALEEAVLVGIGPYEEATKSIGELAAPDGDEEQVERLIQAREEAAERVREAPATPIFSKYPFRKANELLERYGLDKCKA
jgi:hypothetical protein